MATRPAYSPLLAAGGALLFLLAEGSVALISGASPSLLAILALVAPGFALLGYLPAAIVGRPLGWLVAPIVGFAISSISITTLSSVGVSLNGLTVRLTLIVITAALFAGSTRRELVAPEEVEPRADGPSRLIVPGALLVIILIGIALQDRVIGGNPVPGADWGHYFLYAEQIKAQGSLQIDNPYWMLGLPFGHDSGAPSLYGAYLVLSDAGLGLLTHGIWLFAVLGIISVFLFVRTVWGDVAGVIAAGVYAAIPLNQNVLGWHGLATEYALIFVPLALLGAAMALRGQMDLGWSAFLALMLVATGAAHRVTFLFLMLTLVAAVIIALSVANARTVLRFCLATAALALAIGAGVIAHAIERVNALGGTQGYEAFLANKPTQGTIEFLVRELSIPLAVLGLLALVAVLAFRRSDRGRLVLLAVVVGAALFAGLWIVHVPAAYDRFIYYVPILAAASIGIAATFLSRRIAFIGAIALVAYVSLYAASRTADTRSFYSYVNPASLRGLEYVASHVSPGEIVVTDRCWGFLTPPFVRRRVIAALGASDVFSKSEVEGAARARRILYGAGPESVSEPDLGFALADPLCTDTDGNPTPPPVRGRPVYVSTRLVVLRLSRREARAPRPENGRRPRRRR